MKTKVVIENAETTIVLTPENEFEIDVIEKIIRNKQKFDINTVVDAQYNYGSYSKHKIDINIKESK